MKPVTVHHIQRANHAIIGRQVLVDNSAGLCRSD